MKILTTILFIELILVSYSLTISNAEMFADIVITIVITLISIYLEKNIK